MKKILFSMFYSILVGEEPDSVFLKKEGKQNQVKMIWIAPSSCAKDLTISEGTGAFPFPSSSSKRRITPRGCGFFSTNGGFPFTTPMGVVHRVHNYPSYYGAFT